jgi:hypothetical protein
VSERDFFQRAQEVKRLRKQELGAILTGASQHPEFDGRQVPVAGESEAEWLRGVERVVRERLSTLGVTNS